MIDWVRALYLYLTYDIKIKDLEVYINTEGKYWVQIKPLYYNYTTENLDIQDFIDGLQNE